MIEPFGEFMRRTGLGWGVLILLFVICYQLPDRFGQIMVTPFLLQTGFTQTEIGAIQGGVGLGATIVGVIIGGAIIARLGINRSVWVFFGLQILSNLAYYWIALSGPDRGRLVVAIIVENLSGGLVTAVFVGFMMSLCSRRFSATQYALLTSLSSVGKRVFGWIGGDLVAAHGWEVFFAATAAMAIPGLLLVALLPASVIEPPSRAAR